MGRVFNSEDISTRVYKFFWSSEKVLDDVDKLNKNVLKETAVSTATLTDLDRHAQAYGIVRKTDETDIALRERIINSIALARNTKQSILDALAPLAKEDTTVTINELWGLDSRAFYDLDYFDDEYFDGDYYEFAYSIEVYIEPQNATQEEILTIIKK